MTTYQVLSGLFIPRPYDQEARLEVGKLDSLVMQSARFAGACFQRSAVAKY